ncbi:hypothetical protein OSB04_016398 [Centaurea solstitialis]|uniref:Uncharacterized protein n=1 Tax=Centaurea solstitialis TaxID=347529 RepID=A0AA38TKW4_9ASTR|nr:hypothetical protein OSB04_016398 [Centaurea solstitialis]
MSSEVRSSITESLEVEELRELSGLPEGALVGFRWPYSPLARAFMTRFDLSPGQLMPQFWRVIHVIERVTKNWDRPAFSADDLLSAYTVTRSPYNRFGFFPRGRSDAMLVHGTQVNDRGWKARYVFVQTSSVVGEESWVVPEWNKGAIDFSFEETTEAIERFLSYSVTDRRYKASKSGEESDVEPEVQVIEEKDMEGSASKKASTMEAAARAAKRKAAAQEGLVAKRTRSSYVSLDSPPKDAARKAEDGIEAVPLSFAPPAKEKGASSQPAPKVDKGKEKEGSGLTTMTIQMPSDFMVDDVILQKFLGLINYARPFIKNLGKISGPLYAKNSPNVQKYFNQEDVKLVQQLKNELKSLPKLALPLDTDYLIIETDGCSKGWEQFFCMSRPLSRPPGNTPQRPINRQTANETLNNQTRPYYQ